MLPDKILDEEVKCARGPLDREERRREKVSFPSLSLSPPFPSSTARYEICFFLIHLFASKMRNYGTCSHLRRQLFPLLSGRPAGSRRISFLFFMSVKFCLFETSSLSFPVFGTIVFRDVGTSENPTKREYEKFGRSFVIGLGLPVVYLYFRRTWARMIAWMSQRDSFTARARRKKPDDSLKTRATRINER